MPQAIGQVSTVFDPEVFIGYVLTKAGVVKKSFRPWNDMNVFTKDSYLSKVMYAFLNQPYSNTREIMNTFILLPEKVNALHIYAFKNDAASFEEAAMNGGVEYLVGLKGTPL